MGEVLIPEDNNLPLYKTAWLIKEFAKTPNKVEIKNKYKRVFNSDISDTELDLFYENHKGDISQFKGFTKKDIDNHPMSDPFKRLDMFEQIAKDSQDGEPVLNHKGMCVGYKKDFKSAIAAIRECRQEHITVLNYELNLIKALLQSGQMGPTKPLVTEDNPVNDHIEGSITDITPPSDNDEFFEDSDG